MSDLTKRRYTQTHEWVSLNGNVATVGITDHAQKEISDVVFVELPKPDKELKQKESAMIIESVKAAFDIYAPVSGKIVKVNDKLKDKPELVIMKITLQLKRGESRESEYRVDTTIEERNRRHLQNVRAAGSFFMNPVAPIAIQKQFEEEKRMASKEGRVPAGWLIEKVGLKGATFGGAQASVQHPNYLVNVDDATSREVLILANKIKVAVRDRFGITLDEEVTILES